MNNPYLNNNYSGYNYPNNAFLPQTKVPVVNGREGANAYRMAADSQIILMDVSGQLIWIVGTDSAGYKTIEGYDIKRHIEPTPPDYNIMMTKINQLEETLNGFITAINNTKPATSDNAAQPVSGDANTTSDFSKQF